MRLGIALACLALAACPRSTRQDATPLADPVSSNEHDLRASLVAELQDDILKSYDRDEAPEYQSGMVVPDVGTARVGVGPGDVLIGSELERAPSRWPLDVDMSTPSEPKSKRLEIHLSKDGTAAWVTDEISWRIKMCRRTAVIPLRLSALYARDGDRWVPVFEHVSFGRTPMPSRAGQKLPRQIITAVASRDLADELSRVLQPVLRRTLDKSSSVVAQGPEASMIGPGVAAEWHGAEILQAKILIGSEPLRLEDRRVGIVGRTVDSATIAYWIGNVTADLPARPGIAGGKAHLRATFTFERRGDSWVIVQGHISQPVEDLDLASHVFGTALISPKPLQITCDDGSPAPNR